MEKPENLSDEKLVDKIRKTDQELYAIIIERYQNKLLRYANSIIKNEDKAIDIVQESFINAFINLYSFNTKKKFSSWIYRIVHNQTLNNIKKYKSETPLLPDWDFKSEENIEDEFAEKETAEKVNSCLKELPTLYAEPISLFYIDEKSYEEIGDILQIPTGTVATRINRAKKIMKNICQQK